MGGGWFSYADATWIITGINSLILVKFAALLYSKKKKKKNPQNLVLGVNYVQNCAKFLFRIVFPQKGKSLLGHVLKISGHACAQHYYLSAPPPDY